MIFISPHLSVSPIRLILKLRSSVCMYVRTYPTESTRPTNNQPVLSLRQCVASSVPIPFMVHRDAPVLVAPAKPTPHHLKPLSDIDCSVILRTHMYTLHVFPASGPARRDPTEVIKDALSQALVYYYPLAGRLRKLMPSRKLIVECTGEGVMFVEAEADASLEMLGAEFRPPLPCQDQLLFSHHDMQGLKGLLHSPLLLIQVTRFRCGGFVLGMTINHTMTDGVGLVQFMKAIAEIARGADAPSVMPVWDRDILTAMNSPEEIVTPPMVPLALDQGSHRLVVLNRSFFFPPRVIDALYRQVPPGLREETTKFELLTSALWLWRTRAVLLEDEDDIEKAAVGDAAISHVMMPIDIRKRVKPRLPAGYYGNASVMVFGECKTAELLSRPLKYGIEMVKKAKAVVDKAYLRLAIDVMATQPEYVAATSVGGRTWFGVTDLTRLGLEEVDFGWGKASFASFVFGSDDSVFNNFSRGRNKEGEEGILASLSLPPPAMDKLALEIQRTLN